MDTTTIADTVAVVMAMSAEPWWFQYFWQGLVSLCIVAMPFIAAWRNKQSAKVQAMSDAAFFAFNNVEAVNKLIPANKRKQFDKLSEFGRIASAKYLEATGQTPDANQMKKMLALAERLVFDSKKNK